jgi:hypothetical protein
MLPLPNPAVIFKSLGDGAVLFSTSDEVYFGLNAVGSRVWELLGVHRTFDDLCAAIAQEYSDVDPDTIRADVEELLEELTGYGLVLPRETQTPVVEPGARYSAEAARAESSRAG